MCFSTIICVPNFLASNYQKVIANIWPIFFFFFRFLLVSSFVKFGPLLSESPGSAPIYTVMHWRQDNNIFFFNQSSFYWCKKLALSSPCCCKLTWQIFLLCLQQILTLLVCLCGCVSLYQWLWYFSPKPKTPKKLTWNINP